MIFSKERAFENWYALTWIDCTWKDSKRALFYYIPWDGFNLNWTYSCECKRLNYSTQREGGARPDPIHSSGKRLLCCHCQHYENRCERRLYCVCAAKWSIKNKSKRSETSLLLLRTQNALIMPAKLAIKRFITAETRHMPPTVLWPGWLISLVCLSQFAYEQRQGRAG